MAQNTISRVSPIPSKSKICVLNDEWIVMQRSDIGALVKELTDRMDKTKSERAQLQENIDSMELELRQVQEEIAEVTR